MRELRSIILEVGSQQDEEAGQPPVVLLQFCNRRELAQQVSTEGIQSVGIGDDSAIEFMQDTEQTAQAGIRHA